MGWKNLRLSMKFAVGFGLVLLLLLVVGSWSIFGVSSIVKNASEVIDGNKLRGEMVQKEVDHLNWVNQINELLTDDKVTSLDVQTDPHKCGFGKWYYGEGRTEAEKFLPQLKPYLAEIEEFHNKLHESAIDIGKTFHQADVTLGQFLSEKELQHLEWVNQILEFFAQDKDSLNVQTDGHQCALGKFLYGEKGQEIAASDPELGRLLEAIKDSHLKLHKSAEKIQLNAANKTLARNIFDQETLPALEKTREVFKELKDRASELVAGMNDAKAIYATQTIPNLHKVSDLLEKIISTTDEHVMTDAAMLSAASKTRTGIIGLAAIALPIGIFIAFIIARGIIGPLKKSAEMIKEMGAGHLDMRLNLDSKDEIGLMAQTMDEFADSLQNEIIAALNSYAQGDMTCNVQPCDDHDEIRGAMKKLCDDLNDVLGQMQIAGDQIASGSGEVSDTAQALSQGATESAASLEEISASLNELSSQTQTNAENATQANQLSTEAQNAAEQGSNQMESMVSAMTEINEAGQNISKIIKTIDEIAFQTNLLALNAAVEAARAGQHGKGFAVVAEEVRNLAARSAKAAEETAALIEGSVQKTENGSAIASQTAEALRNIFNGISKTSDIISEIAAASNEQAQGVSQISQGINQIDQVTQQNTASAEESAAAAEELSSQSESMKQMLSRFTLSGQQNTSAMSWNQPASAPTPPMKQQNTGGWDNMDSQPTQKIAMRQPISLDDNEFGKF